MNTSGWIPVQWLWRAGVPRVRWTLLGRQRLLDPFFEQAMQRQMMMPFHQLFSLESSAEEMVAWMEENPSVPLGGLIFHMSRCGSTLVSQMLAAHGSNVVASEPGPLDGVLRAHLVDPSLPRTTQIRWLRAMVAALGQERAGGETTFFIKLDCWHVHQAELLREAFPDVPFLFLYREPIEVMVSHARIPAAWTVPGMLNPLALLLTREDWAPQAKDAYCARALGKICEGGLALAARNDALLVNYSELPQAMFGRVFRHLGLKIEQLPAMLEQAQRNAKSPREVFLADTESKQAEASPGLRAVSAEHLQPAYARLEAERVRQMERAG